jgi:hypothetical protein
MTLAAVVELVDTERLVVLRLLLALLIQLLLAQEEGRVILLAYQHQAEIILRFQQ